MSNGQRIKKYPHNKTIILNGRIVRVEKNGRIKSDLGPYIVNHKKK